MTLSADRGEHARLNLSSLIPLAIVALVVYLLHRHRACSSGTPSCASSRGVVLAGSVFGPDISSVLSQLSGGRLH